MNRSGTAIPFNNVDTAENPLDAVSEWFCVQAQPGKASVAAQSLKQLPGVDCFLPQLQYRRIRRKKAVWVVEPLFPGYLFANFVLRQSLRAVYYSQGVSRVVHFGDNWPVIPGKMIGQLKEAVGQTGVKSIESPVEPGDEVQINSGPFQDFTGLVNRIYPGRMRIAVLLEFLGRQTMVEISIAEVRTVRDVRQNILNIADVTGQTHQVQRHTQMDDSAADTQL